MGRVCSIVGEVRSEIADGLLHAIFRESEVALPEAGNRVLAVSYDYVDDDEPGAHFYVRCGPVGFVWGRGTIGALRLGRNRGSEKDRG